MTRQRAIGRSFGAAAGGYEAASLLQRLVAGRLAARIAGDAGRDAAPRILEIGCGTGLMTRSLRRMLPGAWIVATDLAPEMVRACRASLGGDDRLQVLAMDGAAPSVSGGFDVVCSSLALQWLARPDDVLAALASLLRPGGTLWIATLGPGSLAEWQAAHRAEGLADGGIALPDIERMRRRCGGSWDAETILVPHADGLAFLRGLRRIGAHQPAEGHRPLDPGRLRRVLRRFEQEHDSTVSYQVGYGRVRRPARRGVFVTGTDTGIGKTLVAACLVRAWDAEYWKPCQTGLDSEPGDSDTVRFLSGCGAGRIHPPALALGAALSPEDAAAAAGTAFHARSLFLPAARGSGDPPLVVEGAGGVLVPLDGTELTAGLIERLGLPVVLVARSALGTINHTLLSLEALRTRGIAVAGVVLNGPPSPGNRSAIERHGQVRVLAELPVLDRVDAATLERLDRLWPDWPELSRPAGS